MEVEHVQDEMAGAATPVGPSDPKMGEEFEAEERGEWAEVVAEAQAREAEKDEDAQDQEQHEIEPDKGKGLKTTTPPMPVADSSLEALRPEDSSSEPPRRLSPQRRTLGLRTRTRGRARAEAAAAAAAAASESREPSVSVSDAPTTSLRLLTQDPSPSPPVTIPSVGTGTGFTTGRSEPSQSPTVTIPSASTGTGFITGLSESPERHSNLRLPGVPSTALPSRASGRKLAPEDGLLPMGGTDTAAATNRPERAGALRSRRKRPLEELFSSPEPPRLPSAPHLPHGIAPEPEVPLPPPQLSGQKRALQAAPAARRAAEAAAEAAAAAAAASAAAAVDDDEDIVLATHTEVADELSISEPSPPRPRRPPRRRGRGSKRRGGKVSVEPPSKIAAHDGGGLLRRRVVRLLRLAFSAPIATGAAAAEAAAVVAEASAQSRRKDGKASPVTLQSAADEVPVTSGAALAAERLEQAVFDCRDEERDYKAKARSLAFHLRRNVALRAQLLSGEADFRAVADAVDLFQKEPNKQPEGVDKASSQLDLPSTVATAAVAAAAVAATAAVPAAPLGKHVEDAGSASEGEVTAVVETDSDVEPEVVEVPGTATPQLAAVEALSPSPPREPPQRQAEELPPAPGQWPGRHLGEATLLAGEEEDEEDLALQSVGEALAQAAQSASLDCLMKEASKMRLAKEQPIPIVVLSPSPPRQSLEPERDPLPGKNAFPAETDMDVETAEEVAVAVPLALQVDDAMDIQAEGDAAAATVGLQPHPLGSVVELMGLEKSADFNGRRGRIESWEEGCMRCQVRLLLPGTGIVEVRSVKVANIRFISEPPGDTTDAGDL